MKSCFFIGHRDAGENVYPLLEKEIELHIEAYGIREFIVGQYGHFDAMAERALLKLKKAHPEIQLLLLMAYLKNNAIPKGYDGAIYPDGLETVPKRYAILRANQMMIDRCDFLIAHVKRSYGGAWQGMEYARRKNRHIVNIILT